MRAFSKISLSAIVALSLTAPALAQDSRKPTGSSSSSGGGAVSRGGGSSSGGSSSGSASSTSGGGSGSSVSSGGSGVAVPRGEGRPSREPQASGRRSSGTASGGGPVVPAYSRPRGGNAVRGEAVERGDNPLPARGGNRYYYDPYYYGGYYGHPYGNRWGYGYYPIYTGLGWVYYDPYWGYYDPFYSRGYYAYGPHGTRYKDKDDRDYDIGSIRLKVDPKEAEVYVDGLYRGIVDDFDGIFQRLKLEAGAHRLEVRRPGFQSLVFDVLVTPGETTTYRGNLKR